MFAAGWRVGSLEVKQSRHSRARRAECLLCRFLGEAKGGVVYSVMPSSLQDHSITRGEYHSSIERCSGLRDYVLRLHRHWLPRWRLAVRIQHLFHIFQRCGRVLHFLYFMLCGLIVKMQMQEHQIATYGETMQPRPDPTQLPELAESQDRH